MGRVRANFVGGALDNDPLADSGTTLSSPGLVDLPVVGGGDVSVIVLDPQATYGDPEIVHVTAHSASAATATVIRAQEGTAAREHVVETQWVHLWVVSDLEDLEERVLEILQDIQRLGAGLDWSFIDAKGDLIVGSADDAVDNLVVGTTGHTVVANSAQTLGVHWAQLDTAGIANAAVTPAKMANLARGSIVVGKASNLPGATDFKGAGKIPIGDGTDVLSKSITGDLSLDGAGVVRVRASALGDGLTGGDGAPLDASVDDTTIDFDASTRLRVKPGGIGETELQDIPWTAFPGVAVTAVPYNAFTPRSPISLSGHSVDCSYRVVHGQMQLDYNFAWGAPPVVVVSQVLDFSIPSGWAIQTSAIADAYANLEILGDAWFTDPLSVGDSWALGWVGIDLSAPTSRVTVYKAYPPVGLIERLPLFHNGNKLSFRATLDVRPV